MVKKKYEVPSVAKIEFQVQNRIAASNCDAPNYHNDGSCNG